LITLPLFAGDAFRQPATDHASFLSGKKADKDRTALKAITRTAPMVDIFGEVDAVLAGEAALARNVKMYLCQRNTAEKLQDIGARFGISESGVSQASRKVRGKIQKDKKLKRKIEKIEKKISTLKSVGPPY